MSHKGIEQRKWPRLPLKLNVEFSALEEPVFQGTGITANVSAGGAYFHTPDWGALKIGRKLDLRLSGFGAYDTGTLFRSLKGKATVLRLDIPKPTDPTYPRASVAIEFFERPSVEVYSFAK